MTAPTRPVPAMLVADRLTDSGDLVRYAAFDRELEGTYPFIRVVRVDAPCAPLELLPEGAVVERCVTTDTSVAVLASVEEGTLLVSAYPRATTVHVSARTHERAECLAEELRAHAPACPSSQTPVRVWHHTCNGSVVSADRKIEALPWTDIARNYPAAVRRSVDRVVNLERPRTAAKLMLWHGPPGTGKTTAIRALMRAWQGWCQPQYISDPEKFFDEPAYMTEVLSRATPAREGPTLTKAGHPEAVWRLVIAEDSDEYLRAGARRTAGPALGRLLNLADGILGQGMNVLVLLTTNEDASRLHPAIVRPGRCLANIEFEAFTAGEASEWLGTGIDRPMTLAELFAASGEISTVGPTPYSASSTGHYL